MKKLLSALVLLALCSAVAMADVPDATHCNVDPADGLHGVIVCPAAPTPLAESINTVTVRNSSNQPINNAVVVFLFGAAINVCPSAVHQASTNSSGICTITLSAGGCISNSAGACEVHANGVPIRSFVNAKSPDWDSNSGDRVVGPSDYAQFAQKFNVGSTTAPCFDYANNGSVNGNDYSIFARAFNHAAHCP